MRAPSPSCETSCRASRRPARVAACLLFILAFAGGCGWLTRRDAPIVVAAPVVRTKSEVKAHWIKPGEPAPFEGVVLSPAVYSGLREKITRLEGELAECRMQGNP